MENHKIVGTDVGWIDDFKMSRDAEMYWTVTQTYKAKESSWRPPKYPQLSIAPQVPLYDYEVTKSMGYYYYAITWKKRDNEVTNEEEDPDLPEEEQPTGAEQDKNEEINTFNFQRGLKTIPLHEHKIFNKPDSTIDSKELKRIYDIVLSGKLSSLKTSDTGDVLITRPDIRDRSFTTEELNKLVETLKKEEYVTYSELRQKGIENVLVPFSSYSISLADGIQGNPESNPFLKAFKENSIAIDGITFFETSSTSTIDENGYNKTTINYNNTNLDK